MPRACSEIELLVADLQYAAKEVAKKIAAPRQADWPKLKRVARYLVGAPRRVQLFSWQELPTKLHTFTDSDRAGHNIALSSGEAELYALVKGAAQSHGLAAMMDDFDSRSAARSAQTPRRELAWSTRVACERRAISTSRIR